MAENFYKPFNETEQIKHIYHYLITSKVYYNSNEK